MQERIHTASLKSAVITVLKKTLLYSVSGPLNAIIKKKPYRVHFVVNASSKFSKSKQNQNTVCCEPVFIIFSIMAIFLPPNNDM